MADLFRNLKIVILESPYDTFALPGAADMFSSMVALKLRGYGIEYPYGVLPVDTTDFIAHHMLICRDTPQGLEPILGIKSTSLAKCRIHNLTFPGLALIQQAGAQPHDRALSELMERSERNGEGMTYVGSWTIDPSLRQDRAFAARLREIFVTMYVNFHDHMGLKWIVAGGTIRFKIDQFTQWLGHKPLQFEGTSLDPIYVAHLAKEPVLVTCLENFRDEAREAAKKWQHLWDTRVAFTMNEAEAVKFKRGLRLAG